METLLLHPADQRGHADHGWLDSRHSFSFASWYEPTRMGFGALRVLNDDRVAVGGGFGTHPHDNMEIISIPLSGSLAHQDSMGNEAVITEGEVQRMSAGTGVFHSERNAGVDQAVHFLQIWIFPEHRDRTPSYDQKRFDPAGRKGRFQILVSPDGAEGSVTLGQQAWITRGDFEAGATVPLSPRRKGNGLYLFVLETDGGVSLEGHTLGRRDAAGILAPKTSLTFKGPSSVLVLDVPLRAG